MEDHNYIKNPQLEGDSIFISGNEIGILLLHGFTATTAEVRLLANKFVDDGFTVSCPLLPGHGTHPENLNKVRWIDWYVAAKSSFCKLRSQCKFVYIGGESMGSLPVLLLASRLASIDGVFLFAPAINVPGLWKARLAKPFIPWLEKKAPDDGLPWKGYNVYPVKGAIELLKMQSVVKKELHLVSQPILIFTGAKDTTISKESGGLILSKISSTDKQLIEMPDSPHCILLGSELPIVHEKILNFIKERLQN